MLKGNRLIEARKRKGLTQSELGNLVGVGKSAICCYEKETRNPTLETIIEFMHVLGVTADYLLGTDNLIKVESNEAQEYRTMTKEEVMFIDELRKETEKIEKKIQDTDFEISKLNSVEFDVDI